jgi:hypothetical protein
VLFSLAGLDRQDRRDKRNQSGEGRPRECALNPKYQGLARSRRYGAPGWLRFAIQQHERHDGTRSQSRARLSCPPGSRGPHPCFILMRRPLWSVPRSSRQRVSATRRAHCERPRPPRAHRRVGPSHSDRVRLNRQRAVARAIHERLGDLAPVAVNCEPSRPISSSRTCLTQEGRFLRALRTSQAREDRPPRDALPRRSGDLPLGTGVAFARPPGGEVPGGRHSRSSRLRAS